MTNVMEGVRILEVAEHTFVPAASALLADWGAEVIKIEHVERGDAMRGLAVHRRSPIVANNVHVLMEHSNRGKKSLGLDLTTPDGLDILYKLVAICRRLPHQQAAERPREAEDRRRRHPRRTTRTSSTCAARLRRPRARPRQGLVRQPRVLVPRRGRDRRASAPTTRPCRGPPASRLRRLHRRDDDRGRDLGALFHRERTGEATVVDVSLLGTGMWAMGAGDRAVAAAGACRGRLRPPAADAPQPAGAELRDQGRPARSRSCCCRGSATGRRCASASAARSSIDDAASPPRGAASRTRRRRRRSSPR